MKNHTLQEMAQMALDVQQSNDLRDLALKFISVLETLCALKPESYHDHPVTLLFIDRLMQLAAIDPDCEHGYAGRYAGAYETCVRLARGENDHA